MADQSPQRQQRHPDQLWISRQLLADLVKGDRPVLHEPSGRRVCNYCAASAPSVSQDPAALTIRHLTTCAVYRALSLLNPDLYGGPGDGHPMAFQPPAAAPTRTCQSCGCTDDRACEGGCSWTHTDPAVDLCSRCAVAAGAACTP
jgi:hypothetical protein